MSGRVVTVALAVVIGAGVCLAALQPVWADDGSGSYSSANATASGGAITVQAGVTRWRPPEGSSWAAAAKSDPPPGRPNPNQPYGCTYTANPQALQVLGAGGATPGQWIIPTCAGPGVIDPMPPFWVSGAQPAAVVVQVNPVVLAQQAVNQLGFGSPTIEMAPPSGSAQLVGVATWLWIDPGGWRTLSASASAGTVTTTAQATPSKVVWDMGDGHSVTCDGPGAPYTASDPNGSTSCSYTWVRAGSYAVTATMYWSVTWAATGAPGGGNLGVQSGPPARVPVVVTESQAINTATGAGGR